MMQLQTRMSEMSGLALMQAIMAGDIPPPGFATTLGIEPTHFSERRAAFALMPGPEHLNPLGIVHGGILSTLLDSAMGCAVHTTLEAGETFTTLELDVKFVRPVRPGQGLVTAEATMIHIGRQTATAEGRVVDEHGTLYAHATTTCMIARSRVQES
jgi:uncharacterized protein (TIGR00369 family)